MTAQDRKKAAQSLVNLSDLLKDQTSADYKFLLSFLSKAEGQGRLGDAVTLLMEASGKRATLGTGFGSGTGSLEQLVKLNLSADKKSLDTNSSVPKAKEILGGTGDKSERLDTNIFLTSKNKSEAQKLAEAVYDTRSTKYNKSQVELVRSIMSKEDFQALAEYMFSLRKGSGSSFTYGSPIDAQNVSGATILRWIYQAGSFMKDKEWVTQASDGTPSQLNHDQALVLYALSRDAIREEAKDKNFKGTFVHYENCKDVAEASKMVYDWEADKSELSRKLASLNQNREWYLGNNRDLFVLTAGYKQVAPDKVEEKKAQDKMEKVAEIVTLGNGGTTFAILPAAYGKSAPVVIEESDIKNKVNADSPQEVMDVVAADELITEKMSDGTYKREPVLDMYREIKITANDTPETIQEKVEHGTGMWNEASELNPFVDLAKKAVTLSAPGQFDEAELKGIFTAAGTQTVMIGPQNDIPVTVYSEFDAVSTLTEAPPANVLLTSASDEIKNKPPTQIITESATHSTESEINKVLDQTYKVQEATEPIMASKPINKRRRNVFGTPGRDFAANLNSRTGLSTAMIARGHLESISEVEFKASDKQKQKTYREVYVNGERMYYRFTPAFSAQLVEAGYPVDDKRHNGSKPGQFYLIHGALSDNQATTNDTRRLKAFQDFMRDYYAPHCLDSEIKMKYPSAQIGETFTENRAILINGIEAWGNPVQAVFSLDPNVDGNFRLQHAFSERLKTPNTDTAAVYKEMQIDPSNDVKLYSVESVRKVVFSTE